MGKTSTKKAPAKANSTGEPAPGRLLAIDAASGRDLEEAADWLVESLGGAAKGVARSRWDASNTFFELRLGKAKIIRPPVRSLLLLYAADLLFRLRWEIRPALAEGHTIVAAPYVDTAIAYGLACGIPRDWLDELFYFAPKPEMTFRLKEKVKADKKAKADKPGKNGKALKTARGFVGFANALMRAHSPAWSGAETCTAMLREFDAFETKGEMARLRKKLPKELKKLAANGGPATR